MSIQYDEQLIISSGLNIKISKNIHLIDLLRIEFSEDIRKEFGIVFLKEISIDTGYIILDSLPQVIPERCIILFPDWSVLIRSPTFSKSVLISPLFITYEFKFPVFYMPLNYTKNISYKVLSLIEIFLNLKDIPQFIEAYKKAKLQDLSLQMMKDIKKMILAQSKLPYKTLLLDIEEAKELLKSNIIRKSYSVIIKPIVNILCKVEVIKTVLYDINEKSERQECSPTQEVSEVLKNKCESAARIRKLSILSSEDGTSEDLTCTKPFFGYSEVFGNGRYLATPINSPKQSSYSITEIKKIMFSKSSNEEDINLIKIDPKSSGVCTFCLII